MIDLNYVLKMGHNYTLIQLVLSANPELSAKLSCLSWVSDSSAVVLLGNKAKTFLTVLHEAFSEEEKLIENCDL